MNDCQIARERAAARPVPPLPKLRPQQRVVVVDANSRSVLEQLDGKRGRIYQIVQRDGTLMFVADGDYRTVPIDSHRRPGEPHAVIVEPL